LPARDLVFGTVAPAKNEWRKISREGDGRRCKLGFAASAVGLVCANVGAQMIMPRPALYPLIWLTAFAPLACKSAPPAVETRPAPVLPNRPATHEEEVTLIRADSELFAAVVRAQLRAGSDGYPLHIDELRYDPRPYGSRNGYPELGAGVQGAAPELSFPRAGQEAIDEIANNRRRILDQYNIPEGTPFFYPQCAGINVPRPPPPRRSTSRSKGTTNVHAGCPKQMESYVTVGLPLRGQPEGLRKIRDTRGDFVDYGNDVWTTLVEEVVAGPTGWSRRQYAWVFKRSRWTGRLDLAATIMTGVVE